MDFECCFSGQLTPQTFLSDLQDIFFSKFGGYRKSEEYTDDLYFDAEYFWIRISINEEENKRYQEYYKEEYGFQADLFVTADILGQTYIKCIQRLFLIFHEIIHNKPEDFLCTDEYGNIILERRNGKLSGYVSSSYNNIFPYDLLETDVEVTVDCDHDVCLQIRRLEQVGAIENGKLTDLSLLLETRYHYEYTFWIFTQNSSRAFMAYLHNIIVGQSNGKDVLRKEGPEDIVIYAGYFIIKLNLLDNYDAEMCECMFKLHANLALSIMVFHKTRQKGMEQLFAIFKDIIDHSSEEFVFGRYNQIILERRNHTICGHNPKIYPFTYPFRLLDAEMTVTDD